MSDFPRNHSDAERTALQQRLAALEPRVRRRLAGKARMSGRRAYDLDDVFASARRRLDVALVKGRLITGPDAQLQALLYQVAEHVLIDHIRREQRRRRVEVIADALRRGAATAADPAARQKFEDLMSSLRPAERRMLELRARQMPHERIARETNFPISAHRSRWKRLCARIRSLSLERR